MNFDSKISSVKGVGKKTEELFQNLGVYTVGDMLLHFPREYKLYPHPLPPSQVYKQMQTNPYLQKHEWAVEVKVIKSPIVKGRSAITILETKEGLLNIEAVWFHSEYLRAVLKTGHRYVFYGKCEISLNKVKFSQPKVFEKEQYVSSLENKLIPIYPLTKGLKQNQIIKTIQHIFEDDIEIRDFLPEEILEAYHFPTKRQAFYQMHFPKYQEENILAQKRFIFEEFLLFLLAMKQNDEFEGKIVNEYAIQRDARLDQLIAQLPFALTKDQEKALEEVLGDFEKDTIMQRLLEGDVGSGKTMVAFLSMVNISFNGFQSALMAPTEVLARQHYKTFCHLLQENDLLDQIPVILLTGSMTAKEKKEAYLAIESTPRAIIIGTHALIQEKVTYKHLAYVVTDEQHRFGVRQREAFSQKGYHPHILVMSATPIPRTLALILYNNIDISRILEKPANRLPIKNCLVGDSYLSAAYQFIKGQVEEGAQCYVVCPMIEDNPESEVRSVEEVLSMFRKQFGKEIEIESLHGNMKAQEKNEIMKRFEENEISILISTTVIEVGVDVPNATVMMIFNAERFGLAQLHQLRGRIGRGSKQSYCIFMASSPEAMKRLEILNHSNDGFAIAQEDLKERGPGEFFGERQSGALGFALADPLRDNEILKQAAAFVDRILKEDVALEQYPLLREELSHYKSTLSNHLNL